jgi:hypothetical protein
MNTPAPSPTKPISHFHPVSGKRVCGHKLKLDALNKKLSSAGAGAGNRYPATYYEITPKERGELEKQMRERDEAVQKAEREAEELRDAEGRAQVRGDVMVPQASGCESKLEAMEIQLRRMARKGDRSMRRIQKEMAVMSIKQKEVAKNVDKLASDMMILESKMENMEVAKEEDMEIEKE